MAPKRKKTARRKKGPVSSTSKSTTIRSMAPARKELPLRREGPAAHGSRIPAVRKAMNEDYRVRPLTEKEERAAAEKAADRRGKKLTLGRGETPTHMSLSLGKRILRKLNPKK